jgi:hypothetical protein
MNRNPLRVEARRDESLSRWLWLVKWVLLVPHFVVLVFLWAGLVVMTLAGYLAVLVTGRYPHVIAAYDLGVLRWTWRVGYYGYEALGTDRYPPFTLADVPDYPARLHLDEAPRPPRWLPLVAWLFAIPHLIILAALTGAATWTTDIGPFDTVDVPLGVVPAGILIAGFGLLFAARYPRGLHDLLVGVARWNLRVAGYLTMLSPGYPPFRLDQGGSEPDDGPAGPPAAGPAAASPPDVGGPAAPMPVRTAAGRGVAGPVTALIAGVLLLAPGAGLTIGGGALLALDAARDRSGYVTTPAVSVQSSTAAITVEGVTLHTGNVWTRVLSDIGGVRISATGAAGSELFLGIAAESDVADWLSGVAHDELIDVPSGTARYERAPGARTPVADPPGQDFWLATGVGVGAATLSWQATDGDFAVVVANADGSPGVVADVRAATEVPDLTASGAGMLAAGLILGVLAIALIVIGGVGLGRRHGGPPAAGPRPGPPVAGPAPPAYSSTPV